jgi:hypothetical protein
MTNLPATRALFQGTLGVAVAVTKKKNSKKKAGKKKSSKKKAGKKSGRRGSAIVPDVVLTDVTLAERLTSEILDLDGRGKRGLAHNVAEIGRRMLALQQHLGFGHWLTWLSERLPYSPSTAQRYIAVARFADSFPEDFEAFAHLGLLKLIILAQLPPQRRAALRHAGPLPIPGEPGRKRLEVMTIVEMTAALIPAPGGGFAALPPAMPIDTLLRRFRHRVAGLDAMADQLRARADELEVEDARQVYEATLAVAEELEEAFGF